MLLQKKKLRQILVSAVLYAAVIVLCFVCSMPWYAVAGLYLLVYLVIGFDVVKEALEGIGRGQLFDENFLMVLATFGAFATGEFPEAVAVMLLFQTGELFENYAVQKSRSSISDLMNLRPDTARVVKETEEALLLPEEVNVGEVISVRPGERVPLDGVVVQGRSMLDTSALTGESLPQFCQEGDSVLSGVIVSSGELLIRVEKAFYDSTVSKILDMVENASGKKARSEQFITRFSRYYTPTVVILAVLLAFVPPIFVGQWSEWIQKALNFLVVSCPCALVISVPLTFFTGIGAASRHGVLVKGGNYLELLSKADIFVFDKTGTLTKGQFEVIQVVPEENRTLILEKAAAAEHGSLHPIAKAICGAAGYTEPGWIIQEDAGFGVRAKKDDRVLLCGNRRMMQANGILAEDAGTEGTAVYVAENGRLLGFIVVSDAVKPDAVSTLQMLKKQGAKTIMLTGDRDAAAKQIAMQLGVTEYEAQMLPGDKVSRVEALLEKKDRKSVLAFVGDGINDAPVLMRADVGIAMGGIGSDAAIEAADVVLMHDRLSAIPVARKIAKRTIGIVWQNIVFALGIKLLVLALTPFGLVSIWLAVFADVGVAVLAICNAMRAGRL